jgi:hypothetical protein
MNKLIVICVMVFCFFLPSVVDAAVTFVASTTSTGTADPKTFSFNVTSTDNTILFVTMCSPTAATITTVDYNGDAMYRVGTVGGSNRLDVWSLINPDFGSNTVTVDWTAAQGNSAMYAAFLYSGVDQTTSTGTVSTATGTGVTPSVTVTSAIDDLVVAAICHEDTNQTYTTGTGQTQRLRHQIAVGTARMRNIFDDEPGATSVVMNGTIGGSELWRVIGISVKPAATATAPSPVSGSSSISISVKGGTTFRGGVRFK